MQRKNKPLLVTLDAQQDSIVELTVHEQVQIDRVVPSHQGTVAARHGALLRPGTTSVALQAGRFCFKTMSDASLRVVQGGVSIATRSGSKDDPPPPAPPGSDSARWAPATKGDDPAGSLPTLTIE